MGRNKISIVFAIFFMFSAAMNLIFCVIMGRPVSYYLIYVLSLAGLAFLFLVVGLSKKPKAPVLQSILIVGLGLIHVAMNESNSITGHLIIVLGVGDAYDNGYFDKHGPLKLGGVFALLMMTGSMAALRNQTPITTVLSTIALFMAVTAIIYLKFYQRRVEPMSKLSEYGLTPHEVEYIRALGRDLTNKELAAELGATENTVRVTYAKIYKKCGVRSRAALAVLMQRHGII